MRNSSRSWILVLCCCFAVQLGAQVSTTTPAPASEDRSDGPEQLASLVSAKLLSIPDPRSLTREDLPRIFLILDEGIAAGRQYVLKYPEGEEMGLVSCDLGRLLILNVDRHIGVLNEEAKIFGAALTADQRLQETVTYLLEVRDLITRALTLDLDGALRCRAEVILGDCLLKMRDPSGSADAFGRALKLDTSSSDPDEMRIKQIEALEVAERYQEMVEAGNEALDLYPRSPFLPHLVYFTHKGHRHLGLIRQGRDLWRLWGPVLRAGAAGGEITLPGSEEKWQVPDGKENDFLLMADRAGFYEGFYQLALGERELALQALLKFNDALNERINAGEEISMATKTYLDFQSLPMAQRIDVLHGKKAPSLDGMLWANPPQDDPDKKIEMRLFCDSSRAGARQSRFIDLLRKLELEYSSEGLRVVWISTVLREERAQKELNSLTRIALEKKLNWAYGVQPGIDAGVVERHLGSHGGTLLMAIDNEGRIQWEVIDPMFWDEGLYRKIIQRLLNDSE